MPMERRGQLRQVEAKVNQQWEEPKLSTAAWLL
jgi:hypothetical protein